MGKGFTVKYGTDGDRFRYTHEHCMTLEAAERSCDRWLAGNGWGGSAPGELRVWVEDERGEVVYGVAATREGS